MGKTYSLTGPEAITFAEATAQISEHRGRRFSYHADWQMDAWVSTYIAIAAGELAGVTDDVRLLTGRPPVSLDELLRQR